MNTNAWLKWMAFGQKIGCHQKPERSFFIKGYQMPVCARCTGVLIGYLIALPIVILIPMNPLIPLGGCLVMLIDWLLQFTKRLPSTNRRRLITGILGGAGLMYFYVQIFLFIISLFQRLIN